MAPKIVIKKATLKDISTVMELLDIFVHEHDTKIIKHNKKMEEHLKRVRDVKPKVRRFYKRHLTKKTGTIYLAYHEDEPIGYTFFFIKKNAPIFFEKNIGYMCDLFIKKGYRNIGISTRFKNLAMKWFKSRKIKHVSLAYFPGNKKAHKIYKNWGFHDFMIEMRKKI